MKAAIIDVGSNSVRLMTCNYDNDDIYKKKKRIITTRLGKDIEKNGLLNKESIEKTLDAFREFRKIIDEENIKEIYSMATSAVRDCSNSDELITPAKEILGIEIDIISGDREAYIGYLGVLDGVAKDYDGDIMIIDIGGGSTELIIGDRHEMSYKVSGNIGAVRMTQRYISTDPIEKEEYNLLQAEVSLEVEKNYDYSKKGKKTICIGIGGTITSLGAMDMKLLEYDPARISGYSLENSKLKEMIVDLKSKNYTERKAIVGLSEKRADIILAGAVILDKMMEHMKCDSIYLSDSDNLEGYLKYIKENT